MNLDFFKNKRVFITGHTGFKGSWMCHILKNCGAIVTGYSLLPETKPNLFELAEIDKEMNSIIGDVRDFSKLKQVMPHRPRL